ncbi:MAG: hypothetical protein KJ623_01330 [Nanoarchaeota archaeon]|nr:hypothetical protein [Nanoarchaeota archaeon]
MEIKKSVVVLLVLIVIGSVFIAASNSIANKLLIGNVLRGTCFDTDAGVDVYSKGTVYGVFNNGADYERTDYCVDSHQLKEYSCDDSSSTKFKIGSNAIGGNKLLYCKNGCVDGACI